MNVPISINSEIMDEAGVIAQPNDPKFSGTIPAIRRNTERAYRDKRKQEIGIYFKIY